jgi:hypothetical protein
VEFTSGHAADTPGGVEETGWGGVLLLADEKNLSAIQTEILCSLWVTHLLLLPLLNVLI